MLGLLTLLLPTGASLPGQSVLTHRASSTALPSVRSVGIASPAHAAPSVAIRAPRSTSRVALELVDLAPSVLLRTGMVALRRDPGLAFAAYRALLLVSEAGSDSAFAARLGLGRAWLMIGNAAIALRYAEALASERPTAPAPVELKVRALLRAAEFDRALAVAEAAIDRFGTDHPRLRAAHAAALFRTRHLRAAERAYREVLVEDPQNVEALVRLGTGLVPPRAAPITRQLSNALEQERRNELSAARRSLAEVLHEDRDHPIAMRLLGELIMSVERRESALVADGFFDRLWQRLAPDAAGTGSARRLLPRFFPQFARLGTERRRMLAWSVRPFVSWLDRVRRAGGRHDIVFEDERTTDAPSRAWLRGRRTFDGRVWDDVRGIGGLCAATGAEALDDARSGGFQTLVHEVAHQVHLYALPQRQRSRITLLYQRAMREHRALDYYAESNEAEYFAQGVEAYFSYAKAVGQPVTHGHTRFELERRDPELFRFIAGLAEVDPLRGKNRVTLLELLLDAAIRVGRPADARACLRLLPASQRSARLRRKVARAENRFATL